MLIEKITIDNLPFLALLMTELWPDNSFPEELENCKTILEHEEKEICYLIKENENYIAFIHLALRFDYVEGTDESPVAYIEGMYVKAAYRHLGIGKKLIDLATEWGQQKGSKYLASDTESGNTASISFHQKNGFTEANRIVCFVKNI
ncbi:aminoglycoside 6'-N-acetyltransferase [Chitinophaga nivalis]|uniref:Aminoglycoside N(6')-acetyltransferase type 1 n=1 Tax=Chitinophaga nivalis TaxID=2991709 RepID=A0ABT3ITL3_9BACT|nr:aminoglycoside 6'-N-acetyltransferase [Chitinophaga nivalis]MCW3462983.1 GNAT family N-acetyltransferase [Chitinophaga nivalis]MCW3487327.1 GNAT family N-acetyltransferase [Chitinophaga nivalis]